VGLKTTDGMRRIYQINLEVGNVTMQEIDNFSYYSTLAEKVTVSVFGEFLTVVTGGAYTWYSRIYKFNNTLGIYEYISDVESIIGADGRTKYPCTTIVTQTYTFVLFCDTSNSYTSYAKVFTHNGDGVIVDEVATRSCKSPGAQMLLSCVANDEIIRISYYDKDNAISYLNVFLGTVPSITITTNNITYPEFLTLWEGDYYFGFTSAGLYLYDIKNGIKFTGTTNRSVYTVNSVIFNRFLTTDSILRVAFMDSSSIGSCKYINVFLVIKSVIAGLTNSGSLTNMTKIK
jgi:hypothetical protein